MSPKEAIRRLEQLEQTLEGSVVDTINLTADEILFLNQKQLYAGRLSDGTPVSPTYQEDPYFKSTEAAQRYSDWKDEITPDPERQPGVPNLFINGFFYQSWSIRASPGKISFESSDPNAADIEEKFTPRIYGLDDENMATYRQETFFPALKEEIMAQTGLIFS
jgi:hypothetical protein